MEQLWHGFAGTNDLTHSSIGIISSIVFNINLAINTLLVSLVLFLWFLIRQRCINTSTISRSSPTPSIISPKHSSFRSLLPALSKTWARKFGAFGLVPFKTLKNWPCYMNTSLWMSGDHISDPQPRLSRCFQRHRVLDYLRG